VVTARAGNSRNRISPGRSKIERIIWFCDEAIGEIRGKYHTVSDQNLRIYFSSGQRKSKMPRALKKDPENLIISSLHSHLTYNQTAIARGETDDQEMGVCL
jgi:hypothetical protein